MNNRFILTVAALLCGIAAAGQPIELSFSAGTSLNGSNQIDAGSDIAYIIALTPVLELGIGTGLRYARPLYETSTIRIISIKDGETVDNTTVNKDYLNEISIPMFVRIRYSAARNLFLQADAGYRFPIFSAEGFFPVPEAFTGWFVDPQIGYRLSPKRTISLGLQLQGGKHSESFSFSDLISGHIESHPTKHNHVVRPIAFIRYTKKL